MTDQKKTGGHIQYDRIKGLFQNLSARFKLKSVMCFGGEPLLYAYDVCGIMAEAKSCGVPVRQVITNGYFNKNIAEIQNTARKLCNSGVNNLLLSVDAFHQETIPLEPVCAFAKALKEEDLHIKLQPAWVVNSKADNEWNRRTRQILSCFDDLPIQTNEGNSIFPAGRAAVTLADYYPKQPLNLSFHCGQAPYTAPLDHVTSLSVIPNGDVFICCFKIGNLYRENILSVIDRYNPYHDPRMKCLINGGVHGLIEYAKTRGLSVNTNEYASPCGICRDIISKTNALL